MIMIRKLIAFSKVKLLSSAQNNNYGSYKAYDKQ
jgi:hypothetical protein